jgi:C-terminal processing protease CtpA/Prc
MMSTGGWGHLIPFLLVSYEEFPIVKVPPLSVMGILLMITLLSPVHAQDSIPPAARIVNDEGGVQVITGQFTISNPNVIDFVSQPILILEDQTGFVLRDREYVLPLESQVMGHLESDLRVNQPLGYNLLLPIAPAAPFSDVDFDGNREAGVQIFATALWDNIVGRSFVDRLDGTGWSVGYASTSTSFDPRSLYEVTGGKLLLYTADAAQSFPADFGADGRLFTPDDSLVSIPAGYSMVNLDDRPFTFDRSRNVVMNLIEPESFAPDDFSDLTYSEAFTAFINKARTEYAYTTLKNVDWDALYAQFLPRFQQAEAANDFDAYTLALRDLSWSIPDGHVAVYGNRPAVTTEFEQNTAGGLGLSLVETDDGRILAQVVIAQGPAAQTGMQPGAEILQLNGMTIQDAIAATIPYSAPFSTAQNLRLQQIRYAVRFAIGRAVDMMFQNPGDEIQIVRMTTIDERESFRESSFRRGISPLDPPVTFDYLPSGFAYARVTSFSGDRPLLMESWEYFIRRVNQLGIPGVIIDLRDNDGGFSEFGDQLASYFFDEPMDVGFDERYNPDIARFFYDQTNPTRIEPPVDVNLRYLRWVAVLVGPGCSSACELFAHRFTLLGDRAAIVGQYTTGGLVGGWFPTYMPGGLIFALPTSRFVDMTGTPIIEGVGIQPTVRVPVNESALFGSEDAVLEVAEQYLRSRLQ